MSEAENNHLSKRMDVMEEAITNLRVQNARLETTMKVGGGLLGFLAGIIGPVITALIVLQLGG